MRGIVRPGRSSGAGNAWERQRDIELFGDGPDLNHRLALLFSHPDELVGGRGYSAYDEVDSEGTLFFMALARTGSLFVLQWLTRHGVDLSRTTTKGDTLFHRMSDWQTGPSSTFCQKRMAPEKVDAIVGWLVKKGMNPNQANKEGHTALHVQCLAGREAMMRTLLRHGASPAIETPNGSVCLHAVVQWRLNNPTPSGGWFYPENRVEERAREVRRFEFRTNLRFARLLKTLGYSLDPHTWNVPNPDRITDRLAASPGGQTWLARSLKKKLGALPAAMPAPGSGPARLRL
jgi:hypothetical protein